MSQEFR